MSKTVAEWTREIWELVKAHYNPWMNWETTPKALMYLVTECAEAMEAWRDNNKEHFGEELADIAIRLFDTADRLGFDLDKEISKKMEKNWQREWQHGREKV